MQLGFIFENGIGAIQLLKSEQGFQWSSWYKNALEEARHAALAAETRKHSSKVSKYGFVYL